MTQALTLEKTKTIVTLEQDTCDFSPREWDNLTTIYAEHKRYSFSEVETYKYCNSWNEVYKNIMKDYSPVVIFPLYMLDHSCIHLSITDFNDCWDSGQLGYIFITRERAKNLCGYKRITKARKEKLKKALIEELRTYDKYLNGEVYCLSVMERYEDEKGHVIDECVDSVGGFYIDSKDEIIGLIKDNFGLDKNDYELEEKF